MAVDQLRLTYPEIAVEWWPFLLRPDIPVEGREMPAEYKYDMEDTRRRLKQVADSGRLPLVFPERMVHSRRALEATEYAADHGKDEPFHRAVFSRLYGEGLDIGRWDVLSSAAVDAGLDPVGMEKAVASRKYAGILETKLERAAELGIHAVPTFIINDRYRIVGVQPVETFQETINSVKRE